MKKFIQRVQDLSQKASQFQQAVESIPGKAAELRSAASMARNQIQQLRTDVESAVGLLRTDNEESLIRIIQELDESHELLERAGFRLKGVDVELALTPRLMVLLERVEGSDSSVTQSLIESAGNLETPAILLQALAKAGRMAERVETKWMRYAELCILIGAVPSVRIGWRAAGDTPSTPVPASLPLQASHELPASTSSAGSTLGSYFGQSTLFDRKPAATPVAPAIPVSSGLPAEASTNPAASSVPPAVPAPPAEDWRKTALDRFKKMPDLSR
ncbi:MAG: hypothetical protein FJ405_04980 [Verrucomicrobia bacterium]|nr:hypothetical protein [Verrucomicrobiota bacterium]